MIVTIRPSDDAARNLAVPGGLRQEELHITLVYIEDSVNTASAMLISAGIQAAARKFSPFRCTVSETSRFENVRKMQNSQGEIVDATEPTDCIYAVVESEELYAFRAALAAEFDNLGVEFSKVHKDFKAHITLTYVPHGQQLLFPPTLPVEFTVDHIEVWDREERVVLAERLG